MTLRTPGAERSVEEAVAEEVMGARRRVKTFVSDRGPWALDAEINDWLDKNPGVEVLEFFPVSVSTSVAIAVAKAAHEVQITTRGDNYGGATPSLDERSKESTVAAVGIYYAER